MVLTLINTATPGDTVRATWADPDGVGSQPPSRIDTLRLAAGASYAGSLALFNDLKGIEVTPYIRDEGNQHQFFYTPDTAAAGRLTIVTTDKDTKGLPIGLTFTASVGAGEALDGRLNVVLSHFDDAPKDGVKRSPESDIDVDFPVTIR